MLLNDWLDSVLFHIGWIFARKPCARKRYRSFQYASQFAGVFQTMEDRTLLTTSISLVGGDLLIEDTAGGDTDDQITLTTSGANVVVSDPANVLNTSIPAATGDGTNQVTIPLSAFTGDVLVRTQGGNDVVRVDGFATGAPVGIDIDGQAGFDTVFIEGVETNTNGDAVAIAADDITVSSSLKTEGGNVSLFGNRGVAVRASANVDTGGGDFIVDADSDNDRIGNYLQTDASATVSTGGGDVTIQAADIGLVGAIDAGTGNVTLVNSVAGDEIHLGAVGSVPIQTQLFFADFGDFTTSRIQRADLDGSNLQELHGFSTPSLPRDVAVDYTVGKLYWTNSGVRTINRSNLDGSAAEVLVTLATGSNPVGIAVDLVNQKIYWADSSNHRIQRADFDGNNVEDVVISLGAPVDVAVDATSDKVYWTDENTGLIQRSNFDGTGVEDIVSGVNSKGIVLDVAGGKLYFTDDASNKVIRTDLDGSNPEDLVTTGLTGPTGIAIDVLGGFVYWADNSLRRVVRAPIDGGVPESLVEVGVRPNGVAVTPTTIATFALSDAELNVISTTGTLSIGDAASGAITLVGSVSPSSTLKLQTGSTIDTDNSANTIATTSLELHADTSIGASFPVLINTDSLSIATTSTGTVRITEVTSTVITGADLSTGTLEINGGKFHLGANNVIADTTQVVLADVSGAVFDINGHNEVINVLSGGGSTGGELRLDTGTLTIGSAGVFAFDGVVTGDGHLTKQGAGTVTLSGSNTFTGETRINAGTLVVTNEDALGEADADSKTVVADGATLRVGSGTGASLTIQEQLELHGGVTINGDNVTLSGGVVLLTGVPELSPTQVTDVLTVSGELSGVIGLTKSGDGKLILSNGNNSFSGTFQIDAGTVQLASADSMLDASELSLADTAVVLLDLNAFDATVASLIGGGTNGGHVELGTGNLTISNQTDNQFDGVISGTGGLTKSGDGALTLTATQTFTGDVSITGGTLVLDGSLSADSDIGVSSSTTLTGGGTVAGIAQISAGGHLAGELSLAGLLLDTGAVLDLEINGTTPGVDFNQTTITSSINLDAGSNGGGTLAVTLGYTPDVGDSFVIVSNTSSTEVLGQFVGLPETATLLVDGTPLEVTYQGGDGNDVELTYDTTPVINLGDVDNIEIRLNGPNLEVVNTDTSTVLMSAPAADLLSVTINGEAGDDSITIQSLRNAFTGTLVLNGGDDNDTVTFAGAVDLESGSLDLTVETVAFNATVSASSLILVGQTVTQTAPIIVATTANFDVSANDLTLDDSGNDFAIITVSAANSVTIDDTNELTLDAITVAQDLAINTGGALVVSGVVSVGGNLSVTTDSNGGSGADVTDTTDGYFFAPTAAAFDLGTGQLLVDHPRTWIGPSDFGDARSPFPTLWSDVGANHPVDPTFRLGASVDADSNGQPTTDADGDDVVLAPAVDDEDGVSFQSVLVRTDDSTTKASLVVTASLDGTTGFLNAWIDFNNDGSWDGTDEQIVDGLQLNEGLNLLTVTVPQGVAAIGAQVTTRFRLSTWQTVAEDGFAQTGEVEDHIVTVLDGSAAPVDIDLQLPFAGTYELLLESGDIVIRPESTPVTELLRLPEPVVNSINIRGTGGDDKLIVNFAAGNPLPVGGVTFDGQLQATETGDGIQIDAPAGNEFSRVTYTATDSDADVDTYDGSIEFVETNGTTRLLNFRDLEPILDNSNAVDRIFTIDSAALAGDVGIRLVNDPAVGISRIESTGTPGFELVRFASPSNSLTINAGDGNNSVELQSLDASFAASVTINGQDGNDAIAVSPSAKFSLSVFGGAPTEASSGDSLSVLASGDLTISDVSAGDGVVSPVVGQNVTFGSIEDVVTSDTRELSVTDGDVLESNSGTTTVTLTLSMSQPSLQDVSVTAQTSDGTAIAGVDYTQLNQTVTIPAGDLSVDVVLTVMGDQTVELDETFTVGFSSPQSTGTPPVLSSTPLVAVVTIRNDNFATLSIGTVTPSLEPDDGSSSQVTVSVQLDHAVDSGFTIDLNTLGDTAAGGVDFITATDTLTFIGSANETQTFDLTILGDNIVEVDESLAFVVSNLQANGRAVSLAVDANEQVIDRTEIVIVDNDSTTVTIDGATITEGNSGDARALSFTVTLSNAVQGGFDLSYATVDGSADAGVDYVDNDGFLNFTGSAGETRTITVQVNQDAIVEQDESLAVTLGSLSGVDAAIASSISVQSTAAAGTIVNDDTARFTIQDVTNSEAAGGSTTDFIFIVTLDNDVQDGLSLAYATTDGTAKVADGDYTANSATLNFQGTRNEAQPIVVRVANDDIVEADETFGIQLGALGGVNVTAADDIFVAVTPGQATITDDDTASITIADASVLEGDEDAAGTTLITFEVTLSGTVQDGLTLGYATVDGTAVSGATGDFLAAQSTLSFSGSDGETQTVSITVNRDDVVEADETFGVLLGAVTDVAASVINDITAHSSAATGVIINDDTASISISDVTHFEGLGGADRRFDFVVTLDTEVQDGLTLTYETSDITASSVSNGIVGDNDFTAVTSSISFAGAAESQTITVLVKNDAVVETDETFRVILGNITGLDATAIDDILVSSTGGLGLIQNDDTADVSIAGSAIAEGGIGDTSTLSLSVSLSAAVQDGFSISYSTSDGTALAQTSDYRSSTGTLNFAGFAGETQDVSVDVLGDAVVEAAETFAVLLGDVTDVDATVLNSISVSEVAGTATITNDDTAVVTIEDATILEGNSGDGPTVLTFKVSLVGEVQDGFSVEFVTEDGTATSVGNDFSDVSSSVTFDGNDGEDVFITVPILLDEVVEADETFGLRLTAVSGIAADSITLPVTSARGVITNDDAAVITIANATSVEGTGASLTEFQFAVSLAGEVQDGFSLAYSTVDGTATAASGDYVSVTSVLDFTGALNETLLATIQVRQDTVVEADEVFRVMLETLGDIAATAADDIVIQIQDAVATIVNDDVAIFSIDDVTVLEGTSDDPTTAVFTVTLSNDVQDGVSVSFATGTLTADNSDFETAAATLHFTGLLGEQQTVSVLVVGDGVVETDETFEVRLGTVSGVDPTALGHLSAQIAPAIGTIVDDDTASLTVEDVSVLEGTGDDVSSVTFVVTLNGAVQGGVTASYHTEDGTAVSGSLESIGGFDYAATSGTGSFSGADGETQTIVVTVTADTVVEADESFTLVLDQLSDAAAGALDRIGLPDPTLAVIVNDDLARLTVEDADVNEGTGGTTTDLVFTVTLDHEVQGGLTIDFATLGDVAQAGQDFVQTSGTLAFIGTAGETQFITVPVHQDATVEQDESLRVLFSGLNTAVPDSIEFDAEARGRILNDDVAMFSINDVSSREGRGVPTTFLFTVTLDSNVDAPLTVHFTTRVDPSDASPATPDVDFVSSTGTLTFVGTAGEALPLAVTVNADALTERPETFIVELSEPVIDRGTIDPAGQQAAFGLAAPQAPSELNDATNVASASEPVMFADAIGVGTIADANGLIVAAAGYGGGPVVRIFNKETRELEKEFLAYNERFRGGVRLATADVNSDGVPDIITGAGPTGGPHVRVFDGMTGEFVHNFFAYDTQFFGGIWVASGDVDNDGFSDIITGPDSSGGPHVRVFSGQTGELLHEFMAYHKAFFGGVRVASGDINGDGFADIVTAAGPSGGPHVKVFDGRTGEVLQSYFAYDTSFTGGVSITTADFNNDGRSEIVTAPGGGIEAEVRVFSELSSVPMTSFLAYETSFTGGVHLSVADINGDGRFDIVTGTTEGAPRIRAFSGSDQSVVFDRYAFPVEHFGGGIVVGGEITTIPGEILLDAG